MMRGTEDFGTPSYTFGITNVDTNEIQQMLLGFGLVDGLGRTLLYDDFSKGLGAWVIGYAFGGVYPALYTPTATVIGDRFGGDYLCRLQSNGAGGGLSKLEQLQYVSNQKRLGFEAGIVVNVNSPDFHLRLDYGSSVYGAYAIHLYINTQTQTIQILVGGVKTTVGTIAIIPGTNPIRFQAKIVADWSKHKYQRLIVNEQSIDISAYNLPAGAFGASNLSYLVVSAERRLATDVYLSLGYVRLTKDEP